MSYTIEVASESYVVGTASVQIKIAFVVDDTGSNLSYTFLQKGIKVLRSGSIKWTYNIEEPLLVPGEFSLELGDMQGYLKELFFDNSYTLKNPYVAVYINSNLKYKGNVIEDSVSWDFGDKTISFKVSCNTDILNKQPVFMDDAFNFVVYDVANPPEVGDVYQQSGIYYQLVTKQMGAGYTGRLIFQRKGDSGAPSASGSLSRESGSGQTYISYTSFDAKVLNPFNYNFSTLYTIIKIIEDIYQLVNPAISYSSGTLYITHNWRYKGHRTLPAEDGCILEDIQFDELVFPAVEIYYNDIYNASNCGDVLKQLAKDFFAFTGLTSDGVAFFKKLFYYNASNVQSVDVLAHSISYKFSAIDYLKLTCSFEGVAFPNAIDPYSPYKLGNPTQDANRTYETKTFITAFRNYFYFDGESYGSNIGTAEIDRSDLYVFDRGSEISNHPTVGSIYSNNGSNFAIVSTAFSTGWTSKIVAMKISGTNEPLSSGTLTKVSGSGDSSYPYISYGDATGHYSIDHIADDSIQNGDFLNYGDLISRLVFNRRGNIANCRVDKFTFKGINYDFLKDFNYSGYKYQPISMEIDIAKNETKCEALYLGAL